MTQRRVFRQIGRFALERGFYLGGGTAVALLLGHRRSVDFDWFTPGRLGEPLALARDVGDALREAGGSFHVGDIEPGTLHGSVAGVNVRFLQYRYPLLRRPIAWREIPCRIASLDDLACMKLAAAVQRGSRKDFVDIYALGIAHRPLRDLLKLYRRRFGIPDVGHVLVGLSYFDDAERTPMPRMLWRVRWNTIRQTIQSRVLELSG